MKHNLKITIILLVMFLLTQLIGLYVVNFYTQDGIKLPYGFDQKENPTSTTDYTQFLISFVMSMIIVVVVVLMLMKIKSPWLMRIWFFIVITLAISISLTILTIKMNLLYPSRIALLIGFLLAYFKIFRKNFLIHNLTELIIYPGIAAIFVTMLNLPTTIILLIIISIYDIWAVWHSGIMQKMAKYQMNEVGIFSGFLLPYASKEIKEKIKMLKLKYKNKIPTHIIKKHNIKINLAILGGGDIIFPIISAGVFFKTFHNLSATLSVVLFATLSLLYLFIFAKKRKYYPAMPYLTTGIFLGMLIGWILFIL